MVGFDEFEKVEGSVWSELTGVFGVAEGLDLEKVLGDLVVGGNLVLVEFDYFVLVD